MLNFNPHRPRRASFLSAVAFAVAVMQSAGAFAASSDETKFQSTELAPGFFMLQGKGGNLALSTGKDGAFLIDDDYADMSAPLAATLAEHSDKPLRFVVNTHWHFDHTGGNVELGKRGATIIAHENVRKRMSSEQFIKAFNKKVPPTPAAGLPVVTFSDGVMLHLNGHDIEVSHLPPAHTDGDAVVYFRDLDVLHTGDIYFNGFYPFIDAGSGGSITGMIAAADRLLELAGKETRIIPGHGPLSDRQALKDYRDMLATVEQRLVTLEKAGKTREEIIAAKPTRDLDAEWGDGLFGGDQWVGIVYDGLFPD